MVRRLAPMVAGGGVPSRHFIGGSRPGPEPWQRARACLPLRQWVGAGEEPGAGNPGSQVMPAAGLG